MKKFVRILVLFLIIGSLAGITSSCSIFNESHAQKHATFQHKKPLPKKYIISNDSKPIVK